MSKYAKFALDKVGAPEPGLCPCCRRPLPDGAAYRAMVRYGDGDDLHAYTKTKGEALAVLIGWHDDEVGVSLWEMIPADSWDNLTTAQVCALAGNPDAFVVAADGSEALFDEVFAAVEESLMDTPLVGRVQVDSLLDDGHLTI